MDILTINYEWPGVTENCGGGGRIGKELADGLRSRGHSVEVVTDDQDGHYATFPVRSYRDIAAAIQTHQPDVLHGQFSLPSSLALPYLSWRYNVPYVVTAMGADVYDPTRFRGVRIPANVANYFIFQSADAVAVPSRDMKARVERKHNITAKCVHYGIDPSAWDWQRKDRNGPLRILTVCRLVERKNLDVAADAVKRYRREHGAARWRVVGKGPLAKDVRKYNGAHWRGYAEDLQTEFDWADVFFLPSEHEAFGIVFLEALAAGLPVVTSDTGGQTDIVEKGLVGEYARPSGENQTDALNIVADDYEWYQGNTRDYVAENFARSHMVDAYEHLFQEIA